MSCFNFILKELISTKFIAFLNTHVYMVSLLTAWFKYDDVEYSLWNIDINSFVGKNDSIHWNMIQTCVFFSLFASILIFIFIDYDAISNSTLYIFLIFSLILVTLISSIISFLIYHINIDEMILGDVHMNNNKWLYGPLFNFIGSCVNFLLLLYVIIVYSKRSIKISSYSNFS